MRQRLTGGGVAVPVLAPDGRTPELWLVTGGTTDDAATRTARSDTEKDISAIQQNDATTHLAKDISATRTAENDATGSAAVAGDEEVLAAAAAAVQRSLALRRVDVERDALRRSGLLGELSRRATIPAPRYAAARRRRAGGWTAGTRASASA